MDETLTHLFIFPNEIFADHNSSSLTQPTTSLDESPPTVEPADSFFVIPYSSSVSPPPPLRRTSRVSQPSIILHDYVCNSTIVTHEPPTYLQKSSNSLWQKVIVEELQALTSTHTWDLVDLPLKSL